MALLDRRGPAGVLGRVWWPGVPRLWHGVGLWSAACGALAAGRAPADRAEWTALGLAGLLVWLGWGNLWDLAVGTDWPARPRAGCRVATLPVLPYTRPGTPAGRLGAILGRWVAWWQDELRAPFRLILLALVAILALVAGLIALLPERLYPVHGAAGACICLAVMWRRRQREAPAAQAAVHVGLAWLAGQLVLGPISHVSLALAGCFSVAAWGALRLAGARRGLWLLNAGQIVGLTLLAAVRQPLAAGAVGVLFFGQVALQSSPAWSGAQAGMARRVWPWLMAALPVAALAVR